MFISYPYIIIYKFAFKDLIPLLVIGQILYFISNEFLRNRRKIEDIFLIGIVYKYNTLYIIYNNLKLALPLGSGGILKMLYFSITSHVYDNNTG